MSHPNNCAVAEFQRRVEAYADRMALPIATDDLAWIQAAKAVRDEVDRLTPAEADAAHAHSCACGDRAGHEAEDGSDYSIPRDEDEGKVA